MSNSQIQPVLNFPDAPGGRLYVYLAGSTDLAVVYDPVSGSPVQNPISIDTEGYAQQFHVAAGAVYDIVAKDFGGATVLTVNNVSVGAGGGSGPGIPR